MKTEDLLKLAGIGVAVYLVYQLLQAGKNAASAAGAAVSNAYNSTVSDTGNILNNWFGPALTGTNKYYTAIFPDGTSHAVPSNIVSANGAFTWTGYPAGSLPPVALTLAQDANGNWLALES
jgi:hypothetical protein